MEIDENDGHDRHIYRLKKIDEIQEISITERDKRNTLSLKYNKGVNAISMIDHCFGVSAIGVRYNWSWSSNNNRCSTGCKWNGSINNCFRIASSCRKSCN